MLKRPNHLYMYMLVQGRVKCINTQDQFIQCGLESLTEVLYIHHVYIHVGGREAGKAS